MENKTVEEIKEPITKKDPKKVEQGKRLAAISKQAKEEKMRKKIAEENFSYFPYVIYTIAGLSTFGFMYLLLFGKKEEGEIHPITIIREEKKIPKPPSPKQKPPSPKKVPKKFEGFD